jgi:hypothetical protein
VVLKERDVIKRNTITKIPSVIIKLSNGMTAEVRDENKPETDENNKYSKASYNLCRKGNGEYSPNIFQGLVSWLQIEASKGCSQIMKNKAI